MKKIAPFLILAVMCCVAFAPGLTSPLTHYDDPQYLTQSQLMTTPGWDGFAEVWNSGRAWRAKYIEFFPLRDSVYWVLFQKWGTEGTPYHVASLFFHVLATWMMLLFFRQLKVSEWVALAAAGLFAVHPIHIESVTWAAGLKDPMYVTFMMASILAWVHYRRSSKPAFYALSLLMLVLSLLTKSLGIVTPLLLLIIDRWGPDGRVPLKRLIPQVAGHALIAAGFLLQYVLIGKANRILVGPHGGTQLTHFVLSSWAQVVYLKQAFVPATFRLIYCFFPVTGLTDPRMLIAVGVLFLLIFAAWKWRSMPLRLLCMAWYFISLAPVSNLIPFPAIVADRYLYAASVGVVLLLAMLLESAVPRIKTALAVGMVITLTLVTMSRTAVWQNEENLWSEGDEDPECVEDPAFRAAQVHLLRFKTTQSRKTAMAALERTYQTPAVKSGQFAAFCDSLVMGARMALSARDFKNADHWARNAVLTCPNEAWVWNASMQVFLHRDLPLAAESAERAWRLEPTPLTTMLRGLTVLELRDDASARQWVLDGVKASPETTCPALRDWMNAVAPPRRELVNDAFELCPKVLIQKQ